MVAYGQAMACTITNTYAPGKTTVSGSKVWMVNGAAVTSGVPSVTFTITRDTVWYQDIVLDGIVDTVETSPWSFSVSLDKYAPDSHEWAYAFTEPTAPAGYTRAQVGSVITNTAQPATLILEKTVTNDNGGTAVATDWTLSAACTTNTYCEATPLSGLGGGTGERWQPGFTR